MRSYFLCQKGEKCDQFLEIIVNEKNGEFSK
jgi:hypothetical protein